MNSKKTKTRSNAGVGLIIGALYGVAGGLLYQESVQKKKSLEAQRSHELYQLRRRLDGMSFGLLALGETAGLSQDELIAKAEALRERQIEEAIHGKAT